MSKNNIPWGRFAIEMPIIVISILLAFAIDAGWKSRQERILEQEVLVAIRNDLDRNFKELNRVISQTTRSFEALKSFMEASPTSLQALQDKEAGEMLFFMINVSTYTPFQGSMSNTNIAIIRNIELQNEIGTMLGEESNLLESGPYVFEASGNLQKIAASVGAMHYFADQYELFSGDPSVGAPEPGEILSELRSNKDFIDSLLQHFNFLYVSERKSADLKKSIENTSILIDRYIAN